MEHPDYNTRFEYDTLPEPTPERAFRTIWTKPAQTILHMIRYYPGEYVWLLFYLGGVAKGIDRAILKSAGDTTPILMIIIAIAIIAAPLSMAVLNVYSMLLSRTGQWLKGTASHEECRMAIAWSLVPSIASLLLLIPGFALFGTTLFTSEPSPYPTLSTIFMVLDLLLSAWTVRTLAITVATVHQFSIGRAFLATLLTGLIIVACVLAVALPFALLF